MAVTAKTTGLSLKTRSNAGTDENGKVILKDKTISGINTAATNDNIYASAQEIDKLYAADLEGVYKITIEELISA